MKGASSLAALYSECDGRWPNIDQDTLIRMIKAVAMTASPSTIVTLAHADLQLGAVHQTPYDNRKLLAESPDVGEPVHWTRNSVEESPSAAVVVREKKCTKL